MIRLLLMLCQFFLLRLSRTENQVRSKGHDDVAERIQQDLIVATRARQSETERLEDLFHPPSALERECLTFACRMSQLISEIAVLEERLKVEKKARDDADQL